MYNYRRVFTSSAKFKTIYGDFISPIWLNTRIVGLLFIATALSSFMTYIFHLWTLSGASSTLIIIVGSNVAVYQLDKLLKLDDLPFEVTIGYLFKYVLEYRIKKSQLYKDENLNGNNKAFKII
ncbi:MFS transporter permease [Weissella coleopterorum]|uniref:MFS transporter permease n=1 Tax=Weissella coleopterorum TaxID=2714949 RepID=A0A6G8AY02_9LACO|nr:MFS transporter permease [Weissella coleopterorum]QIL49934.1 MFS transporter permease [Weissella coleopterorum]